MFVTGTAVRLRCLSFKITSFMCVASLNLSPLGCTNFLKTGCLFTSSSTSRILWAVCFRGLTIAIGQLHHSRHNHRNVWTQQYVSLLHLFKDNKMIGRPDFSLTFSGTALLYCQVPESLIPALSWGGLLALKNLLLTVLPPPFQQLLRF